MRETDFIAQNKEKWEEFEQSLKNKSKDAEKLSELFIETTDDLSFSRTYYPHRSVRVYLNGVAQSVFQNLYKSKRSRRGNFGRFWKETLPDTMWFCRKHLLWAFIIFIGAFLIGMLSSFENPEFVEIILGEQYVQMTEANIESGDPMAVYGSTPAMEMFFRIAWNNIQVAFLAFIVGILAGVGTVYVLLYNGIMVGAFITFFIQRDLFRESFLAIMLHGTIELCMIVLAGCAGLILGSGLLFPRTYNRLQSLVLAARRGIVVMLGVSAFLVIAAFIESFATRHTDTPDIIRLIIIILSVALVGGYFVYYPWRRHRAGLIEGENEDELQPQRDYNIQLSEIKTSGKIFTESFSYFKTISGKLVSLCLFLGLICVAVMFWFTKEDFPDFIIDTGYSDVPIGFDIIWVWNETNNFFQLDLLPALFLVYLPCLAVLLAHCQWWFSKVHSPSLKYLDTIGRGLLNGLCAAPFILLPLFAPHVLCFVILMFTLPLALTVLAGAAHTGSHFFASIGPTFQTISGQWGKLLGVFFVSISIPWISLLVLTGDLWVFIFQIISVNVKSTWDIALYLPYLVYAIGGLVVMGSVFSLIVFGFNLFFHSSREITEAGTLLSRIETVGYKSRAYGLEKE